MTKWLKFSLLTVLSLFFGSSALAQGALVTNIAWRYTPAGAFPASGATVTICTVSATGTPCSPTITVYSDSALSIPVVLVNGGLPVCITSPQFGCIDGLGNFSFYMTPGAFTYTVTGSGLSPYGPIPGATSCIAGVTCLTTNANNSFTGTNTEKSSDGVLFIDSGNPQGWTGATPDVWMTSALAVLGATGGELYIADGTYSPVAPVAISNKVWIHGAGINNTIWQPTNALASTMFAVTAAVEGMKFSDMTIDMTNAPSRGVFSFIGGLRPILENVRILYPATTGTGTAFFKSSTAEVHLRNVFIRGAGVCVDIQGDIGGENFYTDVVCEDPGTAGYRLTRTTTTDIGAEYLLRFKVTNPDARTGSQAFVLTSSVANTLQPFWCIDCVGDGQQGGHTFSATNINLIYLSGDTWMTNTALLVSNFSAIALNSVTEFHMMGGHLQSLSRDLTLAGTINTFRSIDTFFDGTNTNVFATGATLGGVRITNPLFSAATPMSAGDAALLAGASGSGMPLSTSGGEIWTRNDLGVAQTWRLINKTTGGSATSKNFRVNNVGALEILNDAGSTVIFSLGDPGTLNIPGTFTSVQQIANQGTPCTNAELALSAGWQSTGSATVTAVAGTGQSCSWTITTGTTTGANPTITDTLTNALPAATTVCWMNIYGGTHVAVAGESLRQTTLSATAPIFTANFTPTNTGATYFVTRTCGP